MYRSSWKRATHFVKMYIMIIRSDDSVVEPFYKRYKFILGCHREIILYYWFYFSWAKTLWAAVKCWFQQLDIMTDHFGHLMAHIFNLWDAVRAPVVTHSWLVSVCAVQFSRRMWAWQWGAVCVRVCSELLCCGSYTSRHRERSVPDIWRRRAGKRWHWGVMKKCLCVRGLKNSPFRVVCLLAEQRQGSVSEICCKDYLVCILYQGTANRIFFFLRPGSGCPPSSQKGLILSVYSSSGPTILSGPFLSSPFIFSSKLLWKHQFSSSKNCRIVVSCTSSELNTSSTNAACDLGCVAKILWQGQWYLCPLLTSSLLFVLYLAFLRFNATRDSHISLFRFAATYDTTLSFFWHRHVVFEASGRCDRVGHSCGSMPAFFFFLLSRGAVLFCCTLFICAHVLGRAT